MSESINIQNINSPDYVNPNILIKLAQRFGIDIKEQFMAADTPRKRVELRDAVYAEIRKQDPNWQPEY